MSFRKTPFFSDLHLNIATREEFKTFSAAHRPVKVVCRGRGIRYDGWFNTDEEHIYSGIFYMDIARRIPFPDASVDYFLIGAEGRGGNLDALTDALTEIRRVLKRRGRLIICGLDLSRVADIIVKGEQNHEIRSLLSGMTFDFSFYQTLSREEIVFNFFSTLAPDRLYLSETTLSSILSNRGFTVLPAAAATHDPVIQEWATQKRRLDQEAGQQTLEFTLVAERAGHE